MARKTAAKKATPGKNLIMWVRLPKGATANVPGPKNQQLAKLLKQSGRNPGARCFGGDTCIV
jgi:hypothetical protein